MRRRQFSQRGIALILAMFTIVLVSYLAVELAYESSVEYLVNNAAIQRVKAHFAADAGLQLSLLRVKIYSQVVSQLSGQAKGMVKQDLIDMIWKMPFAWPPVIPGELNTVQKEMIDEQTTASLMDANYMATISDEGSKIDVNSLWSLSPGMRNLTHKQLLRIFEDKIRDDPKWAQLHQDLRPDELINNIQDWVTPSSQSSTGNKMTKYAALGENYPPNRGFRTVDELRLVPGMTEDAFDLLKDQVTVFGMHGLNPNTASKEVIMSIDPAITSKIADEVIARRDNIPEGGSYKDANDFWGYLQNHGARIDPTYAASIPIITDAVYNFRINSVGSLKNTTVVIDAIVYDVNKSAAQAFTQAQTELNANNGANQTQQTQPTTNATNNNSASKGPPRIVYWNEK